MSYISIGIHDLTAVHGDISEFDIEILSEKGYSARFAKEGIISMKKGQLILSGQIAYIMLKDENFYTVAELKTNIKNVTHVYNG